MYLDSLEVHHLKFTCTPLTTVHFGPQAGAQIRGALWQVLQPMIGDTTLFQQFMQLETPDAARGSNPARPFSVRPPVNRNPSQDQYYRTGETFNFSVSLFGNMIEVFPYIIQAVHRMGQVGVGHGRGQFVLVNVQAHNPLMGISHDLLHNQRIIALPDLPVTATQIANYTHMLPKDRLSLHFITPTQIKGGDKLQTIPAFHHLIGRLIERCQIIADNYATDSISQERWRDCYLELTDKAKSIVLADHDTEWVKVRSGSRRDNTGKKISGFTGIVTYKGIMSPFLDWLVWGQSIQIGKNTVKGNGWYEFA